MERLLRSIYLHGGALLFGLRGMVIPSSGVLFNVVISTEGRALAQEAELPLNALQGMREALK